VTAITKWRFVWSATHNGRPNALPEKARHRMLKEGKSGSKNVTLFLGWPAMLPLRSHRIRVRVVAQGRVSNPPLQTDEVQ